MIEPKEINKKLNILFLTARLPYPVIGGDRLKPFNILSYLAKEHNVTLVSFYQGKNVPDEYVNEMKKLGLEVHVILLNPVTASIRHFFKSFFKLPLEIGYYTQSEFKRIVDDLLNNKKYDLSFAFFMRTAEYLKNYKIKKILMAEDCRVVYQKRSYQSTKNIIQKLTRWWEFNRLLKYEPKIVEHFDLTTFVTEHDIDSMLNQNPTAKYRLLTNGTDINKFTTPQDFKQRKDILFAGKLDIWANVLMIRDIVNNILPEVRREIPDIKLNIVGANPSGEIKALESGSIKIIPNVPNMVPYLQNARVFLHPHVGGSGIQNKLIEAMACGCPVVTTKTGIQGIPATNGKDVLIGTSSEELAYNTLRLLKDDELAKTISENARKLIVGTHPWESVFEQLDKIMMEVLSGNNNEK
ncbi:MAG: glycosyltransferase [Bacteroidetes bacterium]|nr:MAG: glycosyltransferase [Bacteroidota bacterium]